ncbi:hypothetical protein BDC45DRAFT_30271 [Circinella umbellata]|nr:hypothetical protein BDC45DRAFT_30271 [Circinella umbellata]
MFAGKLKETQHANKLVVINCICCFLFFFLFFSYLQKKIVIMRIVVTTETDDLYNLEIDSQMAIEDLKALLETESGVPPEQQDLYHNGQLLNEAKKLLEEYGVGQDDLILMRRKPTAASSGAGGEDAMASNPNFDLMRQHVLRDPRLLQQLANTNPELARAALNDPARFSSMVQQLEQNRRHAEQQRMDMVAANSDPFDVEAQKRIEDAIRQENIAANLEAAMEYNPESFARVNIKKNENYFYLRKKRLIECIIRLLDYISMLKSMVANLLH